MIDAVAPITRRVNGRDLPVGTMAPMTSTPLPAQIAQRLKRDDAGLVAAIVQDAANGDVLMLGWMDDEALRRTLSEGRVTFWSRSRGEYWRKGDTSGHAQYVRSVAIDCDGDALLVKVEQVGAACHTGARTCFFTDLDAVVGASNSVDDQHSDDLSDIDQHDLKPDDDAPATEEPA